MLHWLTSRFRKPPSPPTEEQGFAATAQNLRALLPVCPTCLRQLSGHHFAQYAIAAGEHDMLQLLAAAEAHRWEELHRIQTFVGTEDAFDAFAIRCTDQSGSVICTHNPVELYDNPWLLRRYFLGAEQWQLLLEAAPNLEWHAF